MEPTDKQWREIGFDLELNVMYHLERKRFYEKLETTTQAVCFIFSTAAAGILVGDANKMLAAAMAIFITALQGFSLMVGYSKKILLHDELRRRFAALDLKFKSSVMSKEVYLHLIHERVGIQNDEPTPMPNLIRYCQRCIMHKWGYSEDQKPYQVWWRARLMHYVTSLDKQSR